ncbi:MAG: YesL family protein [Lachnospiraceae bacterium]
MNKFFSSENPVFRFINMIGYLWLLNLIFLICCLPIVTIGASTTAMIYACIKLQRDEGSMVKNFFKSFKENFFQSTILWLMYAVVGVLILICFMTWKSISGVMGNTVLGVACIVLVPYVLTILYVFAIQSRFVNPIKKTLRYSFTMSIINWKMTIQMVIIVAVVLYLNLFTVAFVNMFMLLIGFALEAYILTFYYNRVFEPYMPETKAAKESGRYVENPDDIPDEPVHVRLTMEDVQARASEFSIDPDKDK